MLGPLIIDGDLGPAAVSSRDRIVLAALIASGGDAVRPERLAEALWGEQPPASWRKVLQGCVARLRRVLGPAAIVTMQPGYRLDLTASDIDARRFEQLLRRARELLAIEAADHALFVTGEALGLWRGSPLPELDGWEPGRIEAGRLTELRFEAEELRIEAALRAGRQTEVLADAHAQVTEAPLRERRWALLAEAQYRSGRQSEALASLRRARQVLSAELGLDPGPGLAGLERAILRQDPSLEPVPRPPEESAVCPYLGLIAYDVGDSEGFFGRADDTAACLARLTRLGGHGALVVVGPSGSGKSSLVRAGVAAALRRQGRPVVILHPGHQPMASLDALPASGRAPVLVVDQCEEVVTLCADPVERNVFLTALADHATRAPLVVALRADRLGTVCDHPAFARLVEGGLYVLGTIRGPELRTAVEAPARQAGLLLEPGLVDLLVGDVEGEPGALPLLSHALRQTWRRRDGRTLTVAGYRATGGIHGAVANTAEDLYVRTPAAHRPALRDLLLCLVAIHPDGEANRGRVPRRLLASAPGRDRAIEELADARLVTTDEDTVALAHEALTRVWPRLRSWLDEDAEGQRIRRHLSLAAEAWQTMGRPDSELYRGARLARTAEWRDQANPGLSRTESAFLAASLDLADVETTAAARINRRLRGLLAAAVVLLVVALGAAVYAERQAGRARTAAVSAEARRISALARTVPNADQALLLAAEAVRMDDTTETRAGLLTALGRNPQLIGALHGPERTASRAALSDDGTTLVVLNGSHVGVLDTRTHIVAWHHEAVPAIPSAPDVLAIRPGGDQVAIPYGPLDTPAVRLLDTRRAGSRTVRAGRLAFDSSAVAAAYSPDGRRLAVVYYQEQHERSETWIWSVDAPGRPPTTVAVPTRTDSVRFSPDGARLFAAGPDGLAVFDLATGRRLRSSPWPGPPLDVSPDGRVVAVAASRPGEVALVDAGSGRERARLATGATGRLEQLRFSPDGRLLAGTAGDNTTTVWDTATRQPVEVLHGHATSVVDLAFGAEAATLYTSDRDGTTLIWDLRGDRRVLARHVLARHSLAAFPGAEAVVAPGGDLIAVGSHRPGPDGRPRSRLTLVDVRGTRPAMTFETGHRRQRGIAWRPDGTRLATTGDDGHLRIWEAGSGRRLADTQLSDRPVLGIASSRDGSRLIVTDDRVLQLDAVTLRPVSGLLRLPSDPAGQPVLSPDERTVVVFAPGPARSAVYVDLASATARERPIGVEGTGAAFSPDGDRLAVAGHNGEVLLLDATGTPVRPPFRAHEGPAGPIAFSADGRTFVVGGSDGRVTVWEGRTGELLGAVAPAVPGVRTYPAFRPDGHTVTIASADGAVHTWDSRPAQWVTHACRIAGRAPSC